MFMSLPLLSMNTNSRLLALLFLSALCGPPQGALAVGEQAFPSPDEAVSALRAAATHHDTNALHAIFGPEGHQLVSPDVVQATADFQRFVERLAEKSDLVTNSDSSLTLNLGLDAWPFPIPLVKTQEQWCFDTAAGRSEILNRRIGQDELGAIAVCRAYVEAQREYASQDRLGDGVLAYARFLHSTPGTHDGLFWPAKPGEDLSPLGPLIAAARVEGYHRAATMISSEQAPYHGYFFKILTRQGNHAPGGKYSYLIHGRMLAGFALVAWPAEWANTGVMTFIVSQQGKIYQRDFGKKTTHLAPAMTAFDPDSRWTPVP